MYKWVCEIKILWFYKKHGSLNINYSYIRLEDSLCEARHANIKVYTNFLLRLCNWKSFFPQNFSHISYFFSLIFIFIYNYSPNLYQNYLVTDIIYLCTSVWRNIIHICLQYVRNIKLAPSSKTASRTSKTNRAIRTSATMTTVELANHWLFIQQMYTGRGLYYCM